MAQRFGRVNRYGVDRNGKPQSSRIDVVYPSKLDDKDKLTAPRQATLKLLQQLNGDANPLNLGNLDPKASSAAFAPEPTSPPASDILFDAWALTSIRDKMPGRPEVADYLHGIAEDLPQTTIAWRGELDLFKADSNPAAALRAIFRRHRIRPHESLTVNSLYLVKFLDATRKARPDLLATRVALIFSRGLELTTVRVLSDDPRPLNADPILILPASFGGLDDTGMLAVPKSHTAEPASGLDIADLEGYECLSGAKARVRVLINRSDEGWTVRSMPGGVPLPDEWNLDEAEETSTRLVKHLQKTSGLAVRLVQPIRWDEEGDPVCSLVCLAPPPKQLTSAEQTLEAHVSGVEKEADRLASELLANDSVASAALRFAAKWHDEGKKAERWQRYIGRRSESDPMLGKSAEWRDPKLLAGYRHEFGSMRRTPQEKSGGYFADPLLKLTTQQRQDAFELALHLIATHHGYARPHFVQPWDDDFTGLDCDQLHIEVMRRFARLQRKYGRWGLAYLESLLRAADWATSAAAGIDSEMDDDDAAELGKGEP